MNILIAKSLCACVLTCFSHVWFFATPWTVACQATLSMRFSRQEYWSVLPCSHPGDVPNPGIDPASLMSLTSCLAGSFFTTSNIWKAPNPCMHIWIFLQDILLESGPQIKTILRLWIYNLQFGKYFLQHCFLGFWYTIIFTHWLLLYPLLDSFFLPNKHLSVRNAQSAVLGTLSTIGLVHDFSWSHDFQIYISSPNLSLNFSLSCYLMGISRLTYIRSVFLFLPHS